MPFLPLRARHASLHLSHFRMCHFLCPQKCCLSFGSRFHVLSSRPAPTTRVRTVSNGEMGRVTRAQNGTKGKGQKTIGDTTSSRVTKVMRKGENNVAKGYAHIIRMHTKTHATRSNANANAMQPCNAAIQCRGKREEQRIWLGKRVKRKRVKERGKTNHSPCRRCSARSRSVSGSGFTRTQKRRRKQKKREAMQLTAFIPPRVHWRLSIVLSFRSSLRRAQHSLALSQARLFSRECFASKRKTNGRRCFWRTPSFFAVFCPVSVFCPQRLPLSDAHPYRVRSFALLFWRAVWRFLHVGILHVGKNYIHAYMPPNQNMRCIGRNCCRGIGCLGLLEQWQSVAYIGQEKLRTTLSSPTRGRQKLRPACLLVHWPLMIKAKKESGI